MIHFVAIVFFLFIAFSDIYSYFSLSVFDAGKTMVPFNTPGTPGLKKKPHPLEILNNLLFK